MPDDLAGTPMAGTLAGTVGSWGRSASRGNQPSLSGGGNWAPPESWARSTVTRH